jgi:hypothetical protein
MALQELTWKQQVGGHRAAAKKRPVGDDEEAQEEAPLKQNQSLGHTVVYLAAIGFITLSVRKMFRKRGEPAVALRIA